MEAAVGDAEEGARLRVVGVLAVALKEGQRSHEVALLQEVVRVWQPHFLLLKLDHHLVRDRRARGNLLAWPGPWGPALYCA